jgi:hypothetical protein
MYLCEIKFENYHISNKRQPTTNINQYIYNGGKELTEEEIQKYTLKDPKTKLQIYMKIIGTF